MEIFFGCDHNAHEQKEDLKLAISSFGNVIDIKDIQPETDDYINITSEVCRRVNDDLKTGLLICGTGIGVSVIANKHKGIIAARCLSKDDAKDCRIINQANVLCLSAKLTAAQNVQIIRKFFDTPVVVSPKRMFRQGQIRNLEVKNFI